MSDAKFEKATALHEELSTEQQGNMIVFLTWKKKTQR